MIMERLKIGKVVKLDGFSIIIEVIEENISENINFKIGIPISPIMINKLLSIKLLTGKQIICKIDKIYDKNFFHGNDDFKPKKNKIVLEALMIGIYDNYLKKFDEGINSFPLINSDVYSISDEIKKEILDISSNYKLKIGNSFGSTNIINYANPDLLFGKHLGIFGNTGSGKSCTVTSIIQGLKTRLTDRYGEHVSVNPKIIIFDSNSEYEEGFKNCGLKVKTISKSELSLPHKELSDSEYYRFFGASEGVQRPILKEAISDLRLCNNFSLQNIIDKINDIINIKSNDNSFSKNQYTNWTNTLINRIEVINDNLELNNIIDSTEIDTVSSIKEDKENEIFLIDTDFDSEELDIVMFLFSKLIFKNFKNAADNIILILEEAHRYINDIDKNNYKLGNYYIEKIAREGRKFGINLVISSQRPSEISKTVVSQCNSFIIHKITNKQDFEIITRLLSNNSYQYTNVLSCLETQHALIFGEAFNMIDITKVCDAKPTPKSKNPEIINLWKKST